MTTLDNNPYRQHWLLTGHSSLASIVTKSYRHRTCVPPGHCTASSVQRTYEHRLHCLPSLRWSPRICSRRLLKLAVAHQKDPASLSLTIVLPRTVSAPCMLHHTCISRKGFFSTQTNAHVWMQVGVSADPMRCFKSIAWCYGQSACSTMRDPIRCVCGRQTRQHVWSGRFNGLAST